MPASPATPGAADAAGRARFPPDRRGGARSRSPSAPTLPRARRAAGSAPRAPAPAAGSRAWRPLQTRVACGTPSFSHKAATARGLRRALGAESVIDGRGDRSRAPRRAAHSAAMTSRAVESGPPETAISVAARARERSEQRVDPRVGEAVGARGAQQWFFAVSRSARRFTEADALG